MLYAVCCQNFATINTVLYPANAKSLIRFKRAQIMHSIHTLDCDVTLP